MVRPFFTEITRPVLSTPAKVKPFIRLHIFLAAVTLLAGSSVYAAAQVITIDTKGKGTAATVSGTPVDHQYQQIQPTHVDLPASPMGEKNRLEILRTMQSEQ